MFWPLFLAFCLFDTSAWAYIDPGSQLMMIQGALALLGGIVVFFRNPIRVFSALARRLRAFFGGNRDA